MCRLFEPPPNGQLSGGYNRGGSGCHKNTFDMCLKNPLDVLGCNGILGSLVMYSAGWGEKRKIMEYRKIMENGQKYKIHIKMLKTQLELKN